LRQTSFETIIHRDIFATFISFTNPIYAPLR